MKQIADEISLIITTYNTPVFLEIVLKSVMKQQVFPLEVIVADDGSGTPTRELIERYQKVFPVPLIHSWIPDEGFRVSKARNVAAARARGIYLVMIDGDMVLGRHFIEDHRTLMKRGYFTTGSRARLMKKGTERICKKLSPDITFWTPGLRRRLVMLRLPFLHRFIKGNSGLKRARSCNMGVWKDDYIRVNGFEENFVGWGFEDWEFFQRLYNCGLVRQNAKLMAPAVHLYHPVKNADRAPLNEQMLKNTAATGKQRAEKGVDQYLDLSCNL